MHTNAYKIPAKYIIHAIGPRWWDYQDQAQCYFDLTKTFTNILDYAQTQLRGVKSIAIPLISSGVFGVPRHLCCEALYDAISSRPDCTVKLIKLANIDEETTQALLYCFSQKNATQNEKVQITSEDSLEFIPSTSSHNSSYNDQNNHSIQSVINMNSVDDGSSYSSFSQNPVDDISNQMQSQKINEEANSNTNKLVDENPKDLYDMD